MSEELQPVQIPEQTTELARTDETQPGMIFGIITPAMLKDIDVEKMQQLLEMKLKIDAIGAEKEFNNALADFQAKMPPVFKWRAESQGKYNYASYDDIMRLARPILRKTGLSVSASQEETETILTVIMTISHRGGHSRVTRYTTPKDGPIKTKDGRNVTSQAQAQASANMYARRNALVNALDIVCTDEDDNGQAAAATQLLNEHEIQEIQTLLGKFPNRDEVLSGMLTWLRVERLDEVLAARFQEIMAKLRAKLKAEGGAK